MINKLEYFIKQKPQMIECLLIFLTCVFVYLANHQVISSNDSIPNTLLAFNWLENHSLRFDAFRQGHYYMPNDLYGPNGIPYFFVEAPNGHLSSAYPIGNAIVTFPIAVVYFIYLKLAAIIHTSSLDATALSIDITSRAFHVYRQQFEKLSAAILTAIATVIFYTGIRLKFSRSVALFSTFIYAFATLNWVVSSQGLWQHTVSNVVLASAMLALFKANRSANNQKKLLLAIAGIFCGLLPGIRPTGIVFSIAIILYSLVTYKRQTIFLLIGSSSALLNAAWNAYYFGFSPKSLIAGGYSDLLQGGSGSYEFTFQYVREAFFGLLISPGRGFLLFSPVVLFAIPGIRRIFSQHVDQDERLLKFLAIACLILFTQYCFYIPWWGAATYGSRFLVDTLPVLCYLIGYFLKRLLEQNWQNRPLFRMAIATLFAICLTFSTFTQVVGAFSDPYVWDHAPQFNQVRFWDWQDSQISRHAQNLWWKMNNPIPSPVSYAKGLDGVIEQIKDANNQPISHSITVTSSQILQLKAELKNTGRSEWYGYKTGIPKGAIRVRVRFFDQQDNPVAVSLPNLLHVADMTAPAQVTTASGTVCFPKQPGEYKMVVQLLAEQMSSAFKHSPNATYNLQAIVHAK
ncbi:MAG TPA: glycosyltransferase family 39 protein [Crinalium sp.]